MTAHDFYDVLCQVLDAEHIFDLWSEHVVFHYIHAKNVLDLELGKLRRVLDQMVVFTTILPIQLFLLQ